MEDTAALPDADKDPVDLALGLELRRARKARGWTRGNVVSRMRDNISDQTLANYEYGIRPCTLRRLHDICEALGVLTSTVTSLALQRSGLEPDPDTVLVDLRAVAAHDRGLSDGPGEETLADLHRWATNRLASTPSGIARLDRNTVYELAMSFTPTPDEFLHVYRAFLHRFLPDNATTCPTPELTAGGPNAAR